ncbi:MULTISPECIES: RagB/SusD family nutrient uptake outer membrane protein [unclassified Mucilaginibacter]|uniref:RagB/SusD family nutrient uptake outer membrane protein n=1 Tax=unclassified Mucilaginibacter TaxID=2617802 RepID=UPI002AC93343|nr:MULTISPECIES: RagB/SusD family nutrient uptake outer membrane protein [unclassified Mucilaginibacter]MEB0261572.1 RagB/SusD family nutrient uptake outer membrane protein [Mucilaginibacter sp. 10I4]MEB0277176.1 RagB/SusD family nutrient uptake outer membrane protein [Mucilaginibacter sp. 10B2]MEB0300824.1 RagB/SusD family nutrient uptake outer membrane protein [Mucilaginibacter sp. 5C4]WPX25273.1 RagB/SusD family nutrient uptake outer membrane protein [Mucilaginibacter sp. 5C4]
MKNNIYKIGTTLIVSCLIACNIISCKKDTLLNKTPITSLDNTKALKTEADYTALLNSAYDPFQWQVYNGPQTHMFPVMWQDIRADNCISQWASYWTFGAVLDDLTKIQANNTNITAMWRKWYTAISRANTAINFISTYNGFTTPGLKERLLAEAKFVRAFSYFELVKHFGDVPLIVTYIGSTSDNLKFPRTAKADVYSQIEKDLGEAYPILPANYADVSDKGRTTKGAALTLLAKVELYQKKWDKVKTYTEMVMGLGYQLEANFADNWSLSNEYGKESIFEIGYQSGIYNNAFESPDAFKNQGSASYQMFGFIPAGTGAFGNSVPRQQLIDLYNSSDQRKDATFIIPTTYLPDLGQTGFDAGTQYYHYYWTNPDALVSQASMRKYYIPKSVAKSLSNLGSDPLNEKVFRYADVLLMHAEASIMGAGGDGLGSLNQVIQRAYGNASHNLSTYTLADVKLQRRLELATEGWDRFTDLVRWGDASSALAFKHFTVGRDELLPIPQAEIDIVGSNILKQNPGY